MSSWATRASRGRTPWRWRAGDSGSSGRASPPEHGPRGPPFPASKRRGVSPTKQAFPPPTGRQNWRCAGAAPTARTLAPAVRAVGVAYDTKQGVRVDDTLRTTNSRIFAAGDVCMDCKFTHAADAAARIVIQNSLFFGRKRLSALVMPWCTYTDPEIAHVGTYERDALKAGIEV